MSSGQLTQSESLTASGFETPSGNVPARPGWMKKSPATPKPARTTPPPAVSVDADGSALPPQPTTWSGRLAAEVFRVSFGMGWLVSGLIHIVLLGSLGLLAFHTHRSQPAEITGVFGVPGNDTVLDVESSMDAGGSLAPLEFESSGAPSTIVDPAGVGAMPSRILGDVAGQLGGNGLGDGGNGSGGLGSLAGNLRVPASAVTRGSFTVFTEPEDPVPGRPYEIVIQVKMSPEIKGYRLRDLTGRVTGTDGYEKAIRFKSTDRKAVKDGVVQVRIDIPGAQKLVKDTIFIRSEVLKEEQTIEIVF